MGCRGGPEDWDFPGLQALAQDYPAGLGLLSIYQGAGHHAQVSLPLLPEPGATSNFSEPERGNPKAGFYQDTPHGTEVKSPDSG